MAHSIVAVEVSDIQVCLPSRYTGCRNSITYKHLRLKSSLVKILLGLDMASSDGKPYSNTDIHERARVN